jgi:hypothetical protein
MALMESYLSKEILEKTFNAFFNYVAVFVGENKAWEFARHSRQETEKYYSNLVLIQIGEDKKLNFLNPVLSDKELLGFSLWMHKFIADLKDFMVGVGKVELDKILGNLKKSLATSGFLEFFEQARELSF